MKITKKIKVCLFALILIIFGSKNYAITQEEAGQIIAQFAINFYDNYASETIYSLTNYTNNTNSHRAFAYRGQKVSGSALPSSGMRARGMKSIEFTDKYAMDCVGFVSFCIHHSLGIGNATTFTCFVTPQSGGSNGFVQVTDGSRKPGDILSTSGHVAVYIGNGEIIDSAASGPNRSITRKKTAGNYPKTFRINQTTAANIDVSNTTVQFEGRGSTEYTFGDENSMDAALTQILSGTVPEHWTSNCKDYTGTFNWTNVSYVSTESSGGTYVDGSSEQYVGETGAEVLSSAKNKEILMDLFDGSIPTTQSQMTKWLVTVQVPYLDKSGNRKTRSLQVHKKLAQNFINAFTELADSGFKAYSIGTYCWRKVNNGSGSNALSQHSYGVALDINPNENPYPGVTGGKYEPGVNEYSITPEVVSIMNKYGFRWGGSYQDYMHFSVSGR